MALLSKIKQEVMDIEHSTGQHTWDHYIPRDEKPKPDVKLSRVAHGLRVQVAVVSRRIEVVAIWVELLLESLTITNQDGIAGGRAMKQWLRNLQMEVRMAKMDVEFNTKRAENQVGAVSNILRFAYLWMFSLTFCVRYTTDSLNAITSQVKRSPKPLTRIPPL